MSTNERRHCVHQDDGARQEGWGHVRRSTVRIRHVPTGEEVPQLEAVVPTQGPAISRSRSVSNHRAPGALVGRWLRGRLEISGPASPVVVRRLKVDNCVTGSTEGGATGACPLKPAESSALCVPESLPFDKPRG